MKTRNFFLAMLVVMLASGFAFISCDSSGDSGGGGNRGRFYADYIRLGPSWQAGGNSIHVGFYSYSGDGYYEGTLQNIRNEFTVSINGQAVTITDYLVGGTGIWLDIDGTYTRDEEYSVRVTYRAASPNRLWVDWNGRNYIGNFTFDGVLIFDGPWVRF